jgi:type II secretory ATPase GspE/PulE/Tfp pilus assembly ATPase PilB-like protein
MLAILAQRLVRRLCTKCKVLEPLHKQGLQDLAAEYCLDTALSPDMVAAEWLQRYSGAPKLSRAPGCLACGNSGYAGRLGIHELLVNSPLIRPLIRRSAGADELRAAGIAEGMRTLRQDGIEKCLDGLADLQEVRGACA